MANLNADAAEPQSMGWRFDNSYSRSPEALFALAKPTAVKGPRLVILNRRLADEMGLDFTQLSPDAASALFAGQVLPGGAQPIAQAYAGHQFGNFTILGDGRAALGPLLREYIISEAMFALGIPTTRSLAVVTTGEPVAGRTLATGGVHSWRDEYRQHGDLGRDD